MLLIPVVNHDRSLLGQLMTALCVWESRSTVGILRNIHSFKGEGGLFFLFPEPSVKFLLKMFHILINLLIVPQK